MLSIFQKATDKARSLLMETTSRFRHHVSMVEKDNTASSSSSKLQALYQLCTNTFIPSGIPPPSSGSISKLCSLLDTVGPADVGLQEEKPDEDCGRGFFGVNRLSRMARWAQPITYIDIYECDSFKMCIFCFPTSSVIPFHDHPGMTVFSKVLYGSLHVKAYDWVEPACMYKSKGSGYPPVRLAKLAVDKVLTAPCGTSVLYPKSGGNLHCFTAVTPCAMLDILTPPYREDMGRKCNYYHDYPYSIASTGNGDQNQILDGKVEDYAWLAEIDTPDNLYFHQCEYAGPTIQV